MKKNKQNPDFLYIGNKILAWYNIHGRDLPFRNTKDPYKIWICEIVFQQTRISQGLDHYNKFIARFPDIFSLAKAHEDDVILHWKGLGYYSRAINIHKASLQIINDFNGKFPNNYSDIISLKGIGKYTASAISSICFDEKRPAIDGNFHRVISRLFADDYDISQPKSFEYFSELSLKLVKNKVGDFNQAIMDLGSEICKPKNPNCSECPINEDCLAFEFSRVQEFPVKTKKVKVENLNLEYFFVHHENEFAIQQRGTDFIWKKLFEFPTEIPVEFEEMMVHETEIQHKLTHKNLNITIKTIKIDDKKIWDKFLNATKLQKLNSDNWHTKSFPKPLENFTDTFFTNHEK